MASGPGDLRSASWLLCRVGSRLCALPLASVIETMRRLPIEPLADAPRFVLGLSIIRGSPVPVVDIGPLFGEQETRSERLVTLNVGGKPVALVVESVLGVRAIESESLVELPPLLRDAAAEIVSAVGALDAELLLFLRAARLMPEASLGRLGPQASVS